MRVITIEGDPNFILPGWHRVLSDSGQSLAFFRHQAEADAFVMRHGYGNTLTKGRQMAAMLTAHKAVSFSMADMTARLISGFRGTRQDQQQRGKSLTFLFDDGSEFPFTPTGD